MATTKKADGTRPPKVADAIRAELMKMLLAGEVHDPGLHNVVVSGVEITADLRLAKVYVRALALGTDDKARAGLLRSLERAKGFLRRGLGQRLRLRYAPDLRFYYDDSIDRGADMEALLREIRQRDGEPQG